MSLSPKKKKVPLSKSTKSVRSREARKKLLKIHEKRSPQAQEVDEHMSAEIAPTIGHWVREPNEYDVPGVDQPIEWRSTYELEDVKDHEIELRSKKDSLEKLPIKIDLDRLKWQKKHPFISGRIIYLGRELAEHRDGRKAYEWALEDGKDYGFDIKHPHSSFLDTYNLKRYDIKGMRVCFVDEHHAKKRGALAWYSFVEGVMFVPPISGKTDHERRADTVRHEVGHHIYDESKILQEKWHYDKVKMWKFKYEKNPYGELVKVPYLRPLKKSKKKYDIPIGLAIMEQDDYFSNYEGRRKENWKYKRLNARERKRYRYNEMFAETFRIYRSGQLKKDIKEERFRVEYSKDLLKGMKKDEKRKDISAQRREELAKRIPSMEMSIRRDSANLENLMAVERWMKKNDAQMWHLGKGSRAGRKVPKGSSFIPKKRK